MPDFQTDTLSAVDPTAPLTTAILGTPLFAASITEGADEWRFGAFSNPHYTLFVGLSHATLQGAASRAALFMRWTAGRRTSVGLAAYGWP